ncbi:MAG TPA: hypothetical protein VIM14_20600 [Polyangia bacterium]
MISALALGLLGLLQADVAEHAAVDRGETAAPTVVVVALPANANRAILEALNRLRGEATSVGFEVRFVEPASESTPLDQLDSLALGLPSAAVVTLANPEAGARDARSLDVWFKDRSSGKTAFAHLTADEYDDGAGRGEVVLAVRAVDFIRARMFDTLVRRPDEHARPKPQPEPAHVRRAYLSAGIGALGGWSGFLPSLAPQIEMGYRLAAWGRISASAFGFGTRPNIDGSPGRVSLDPSFVGASLTLLGRSWRHLQPLVEVGGGECWIRLRGETNLASGARSDTLASPGALMALGLAVDILPYLGLELRAGTLWLQSQAKIYSTDVAYLGSVGRPAWFSSARLGTSF